MLNNKFVLIYRQTGFVSSLFIRTKEESWILVYSYILYLILRVLLLYRQSKRKVRNSNKKFSFQMGSAVKFEVIYFKDREIATQTCTLVSLFPKAPKRTI